MSDNNSPGDENRANSGDGVQIAAKQTLVTRSFVIIWLVNFLNAVVFLLLMIVMSKVATDRFGASPAVAGLSASIFVIGAFVIRPLLGKRIHHIGQTRTLYIGSILSVALTLAYFAVNSNGTASPRPLSPRRRLRYGRPGHGNDRRRRRTQGALR